MSDEVRVDPLALDSQARVAEDVAAALEHDLIDVEPESVQAVQDLSEWRTGRAVEDLVWFWRDDLKKLTGQVNGVAEGLRQCARDYRHTDTASADHFRSVAGW
ncbi:MULTISPECIES: type VII secretion target [Salinispora]|uniref:type VII secretion target n=1 Tax=Salinispora TaxID=168694 RepID=UPI0003A52B7F|nr:MULTISPECIES: type VII secretion target [Salinispora]